MYSAVVNTSHSASLGSIPISGPMEYLQPVPVMLLTCFNKDGGMCLGLSINSIPRVLLKDRRRCRNGWVFSFFIIHKTNTI